MKTPGVRQAAAGRRLVGASLLCYSFFAAGQDNFAPTLNAGETSAAETSGTSAAGTSPPAPAADGSAFDLEIQAPTAVRELLERHLELPRYRVVNDLDADELTRLLLLAEAETVQLLGTLGFFSPTITLRRENRAGRLKVLLDVAPGVATVIRRVDINFAGDLETSTDADAVKQRHEIRRDWRLPVGQRFTQDGWAMAKTQALRALLAHRYPAGRVGESRAEIDPASHGAALTLRLDSGPVYHLGEFKVQGLQRYPREWVLRLARLNSGAVYDQNRLLDAQQRLVASGYFDSAMVLVDPQGDPVADPSAVPVDVQVHEAPRKKIVLGVGVTTDRGPHVSIEHTDHRVPGIGWRATSKLQIEEKAPFVQNEWLAPPDAKGWRWNTLARAERLDDGELLTRAQRLRFGRAQAGDHTDRNIYLQYDRASVRDAGDLSGAERGDGATLSANYAWTGRYFDHLPFPSRGDGFGAELGGGFSLGDSRQPFVRAVGRWLGVRPLPLGRLALRLESGGVWAAENARIPATQMFRTGGDNSVRGYRYRSIGIEREHEVTGPGRYLAIGSVEWQRPMLRRGLPSEWENTVFVDLGAVADTPRALRPVVGVGTGVRWRSPIGPLQLDVAYGLAVHQVQLHLSVGFVF